MGTRITWEAVKVTTVVESLSIEVGHVGVGRGPYGVVDAILASNTLYEKFWQHNGCWGGSVVAVADILYV